MAQDQITVFRLALSAIGITDLPDSPLEDTPGANACRLWFQPVLDYLLRAAHWPSAKGAKRIGLLAERDTGEDWVATDPLPGWQFMYQAPADMIAPRYLSDYSRFETGEQSNKRVIYTDMEDGILIYTKRQDNLSVLDPSLFMALSHALGGYICQGLTGKNQKAINQMQLANQMIAQARADTANDAWEQRDSVPEWITARGYAGGMTTQRFIYPYGPMLVAPGAPLV